MSSRARIDRDSTLESLLLQVTKRARARGIGSQAELARRAGITPETLSRVRSRGTADFSTVVRLAEAAGMELSLQPKAAPASTRRSVRPALAFPYDWSNPEMPDALLIRKVLERARLEDVVEIVRTFGYARVKDMATSMNLKERPALQRTLRNIKRGMKAGAVGRP